MIRRNPSGDIPQVHPDAFVDPTAILIGKVIIDENVFIGPYAVIRADETDENGEMQAIHISASSNIQDGVVIHSKSGAAVYIGKNVSIAHRAIVHGPALIGDSAFIGFNSVVFNATIGEGSVIRHNSVLENIRIPDGFHIPSSSSLHSDSDLSKIPQVTPNVADFSEDVVRTNNDLVKGYKKIQNEF